MQTTTASGTDTKWTEEAAPVELVAGVGAALLLVPVDKDVGWVVLDEGVTLGVVVRVLGTFVPETELSGVVMTGNEMEVDPDITVGNVSMFPLLSSLRTKLSEKTIELDCEQ
jgi:hypothetical protein